MALAGLVLLVILGGCASPAAEAPARQAGGDGKNLTVYFIDVGQGDSILMRDGNFTVLVDGGKADAAAAVIRALRSADASSIDLLVATHADSDHIGGLPAVLASVNASQAWDSGMGKDTKAYDDYFSRAESEGNVSFPKRGFLLNISSGLSILVLNPAESFEFGDTNNNGLVLLVEKGGERLLLTADCEDECERSIMSSGLLGRVSVLKVGHHGSAYSTSREFLQETSPRYAVISVGPNSYGHPSLETIGRLESAGARVLRTDESGTIVLTTDGIDGSSISTER